MPDGHFLFRLHAFVEDAKTNEWIGRMGVYLLWRYTELDDNDKEIKNNIKKK